MKLLVGAWVTWEKVRLSLELCLLGPLVGPLLEGLSTVLSSDASILGVGVPDASAVSESTQMDAATGRICAWLK